MIKKVFVGVFLAIIFGLLVFGAVNRTLAKTNESEPLALSKNLSEGHESEKLELSLQQNKNLSENKRLEKNINQGGQGSGQYLSGCDAENISEEVENRQGTDTQGNRIGNAQGGQPENAQGYSIGTDLAEVTENIILNGAVISMTADLLTIELSDGSLLEIEGRALSFLIEQGFIPNVGDALALEGFYDSDKFEVSYIENNMSDEAIRIREVTGRPLWAGGYGGNQNR